MDVNFTVQVPKCPELEEQIQRAIQKLERLLVMFQPQLVHFHGRMIRHTSREGVICSLNLVLPTAQLASEETANTAQLALRLATNDLIEQTKRHKERLRREHGRRGRATLRTWPVNDAAPPAPAPEQERQDLADYIAANLGLLRRFVARQLRLRERLGEIRPGQLDVREVLDEMIAQALEDTDGKHPEPPRWFYLLAVRAIRTLASLTDQNYGGDVAVSLDRELTEKDERREERFEFLDPEEEAHLEDITPHAGATPEDITYSHELIALLQAALLQLSPAARSDMVLFALEGFSIDELAMISGRRPDQVHSDLQRANDQLRHQTDIPNDLRRKLVEEAAQRLGQVA